MVRSIVLVGGQEVPSSPERRAMNYARQLKAKWSLARYNSLVEGVSSGSNPSTFDFATTANLSIDYSANDNLSCEYSQSEDGDLRESPLLAVIEGLILGQKQNQNVPTSPNSGVDDLEYDSGSSVFSFDSDNEFSVSRSGMKPKAKTARDGDEPAATAIQSPPSADSNDVTGANGASAANCTSAVSSPSSSTRQKLKRWRQFLPPKLRKPSDNANQDDGLISAAPSETLKSRLAISVADPDHTELDMFSSESMDESTILILARSSTLSTFQKRKGPIASCLQFDSMLRCGPNSAHATSTIGPQHFGAELPCTAKPTNCRSMPAPAAATAKREIVDHECPHLEAQSIFTEPLTRAFSEESVEETEIVFCDSDDFSVGNEEKLWGNPRLWERWAPPAQEPFVPEEPIHDVSVASPQRRARSLENPILPKMPQQEFNKSRTTDQKVTIHQVMEKADTQASFLRDEGIEIVESVVLTENANAVAKPRSPLEKKVAPFLAKLRSPRALPPLVPKALAKVPEPTNPAAQSTEHCHPTSHQDKAISPVLCSHCRHQLTSNDHHSTIPPISVAVGQAETVDVVCEQPEGPTVVVPTAKDAIPSKTPTASLDDKQESSNTSDVPPQECPPSVEENQQKVDNTEALVSRSQTPSSQNAMDPSKALRPAIKLTIETTRHDQATTPEGGSTTGTSSHSTKPWGPSGKFQEVAPKIDFLECADEIELVREAPVRLPSRFFWRTRRGRSAAVGLVELDPPVLASSRNVTRASFGPGTPAGAPMSDANVSQKERAMKPFGRVKKLFQSSTKNDACDDKTLNNGLVNPSLQKLLTIRSRHRKEPTRNGFHGPSPISVLARTYDPAPRRNAFMEETIAENENEPIVANHDAEDSRVVAESLAEESRVGAESLARESRSGIESSAKEVLPLPAVCLDEMTREKAIDENSSPVANHPEVESKLTYDEALVLEQTKKLVHAESGRFASAEHRLQRDTPVTLYPYIDFNPCEEELLDDNSYDVRKHNLGLSVGYPFKPTPPGQLAQSPPKAKQATTPAKPTTIADVPNVSGDAPGKKDGTADEVTLKICSGLVRQQSHSDSSSSSLKKVLRRLAKHRVAFKDEIDEPRDGVCTNQREAEVRRTTGAADIDLEANASDIVLRQLALPNEQECKVRKKSETGQTKSKATRKPTRNPEDTKKAVAAEGRSVTISSPRAGTRINILSPRVKAGLARAKRISIGGNTSEARKQTPEILVESPIRCPIVRELILSPSDTTQTSVRFAEPRKTTKRVTSTRDQTDAQAQTRTRQPLVSSNDGEAIKRGCDETVATGGTKISALSGISRLTTAEKKLARRLASDISILAKIEKKRRAMGQAGSTTKAQEIEKSLKLLQSINASRNERKTKEGGENGAVENVEPATDKEPPSTFGNLFGALSGFGK